LRLFEKERDRTASSESAIVFADLNETTHIHIVRETIYDLLCPAIDPMACDLIIAVTNANYVWPIYHSRAAAIVPGISPRYRRRWIADDCNQ